jgi:hypothetical protein
MAHLRCMRPARYEKVGTSGNTPLHYDDVNSFSFQFLIFIVFWVIARYGDVTQKVAMSGN